MRDTVTLTEEDEGKKVINANGDEVGRVIEVEHGTAHVEPDPGLADTIKSKLGWGDSDEDTYRLDAKGVERVSDDEIHLDR
jgi:sporulation protein YlmC with PRC-barrel domain